MSKSRWDYKVDADTLPLNVNFGAQADYRKKLANSFGGSGLPKIELPKSLEVAKASTEAATKSAMDKAKAIESTVTDGIRTGANAVRDGLDQVGNTIGRTVGGALDAAKGLAGALTGGSGGEATTTADKPGIKPTKNVFVCDGNDQLQAVDPYDEGGDNPINKVTSSASTLAASVKSSLKSARDYIKVGRSYVAKGRAIYKKGMEYKKAFDAINNGKGSMVNRIIGNNKLIKGALNDMGYGDVANNSIMKFVESNASAVIKYDNFYQKVRSTDFDNQRQVANLLNTYSKDGALFKFDDVGASVSLGARVIQDATKYGFPNSFSTVVKTLEGGQAVQQLANASLPAGITYSDFKLIGEIHDTVGEGAILFNRPQIMKEFADAYNRPWDSPSAKDHLNYNNVVTMYQKVDADWNLSYRDTLLGKEPVLDFSQFGDASDQFKEMMETGSKLLPKDSPLYDRAMAAIKQIRTTTVRDEIRKHFPTVIINRSMQSTRLATDPILLA